MAKQLASSASNVASDDVIEHIKQHSIIIVDDSKDDQELLLKTLKSFLPEEKNILVFNSGKELIEYLNRMDLCDVEAEEFEAELPEMIFLDLMMPRMDGIETLKTIKSQSLWCDIPVTLVTCSRNDLQVQQAELAGANAFLPKPFTAFDVVKTLNKANNYSARIV